MADEGAELALHEAFIDGSTLRVTDLPGKSDGPRVEFTDAGPDYPGGSDIKSVPRPAPTVGRP